MTVANFVGLAEGTKTWMDDETGAVHQAPFYDGIIFHRVISDFMIQAGSRNQIGTDGPGYRFPDEISNGLLHDSAGILSMANSGLDSNGSQFFITVKGTPWLDGIHTVFGRVISGQDVVQAISSVATDDNNRPMEDVAIQTIDILRIGTDAAAFDGADLLPIVQGGRIDDVMLSDTGLEMTFEPAPFHAYHLRTSSDLSTWSVTNLIRYADSIPETESIIRGTNLTDRTFYALVELDYPGNQYPLESLAYRWIEFDIEAPQHLAGLVVRYTFGMEYGNTITLNGDPFGEISGSYYEYLLYPNRSFLLVAGTQINRIDYRLDFDSPTSGTFSATMHSEPRENRITGTFTTSE